MKRSSSTLALIPPLALLAACSVPLGPGYTVKKQQLEARWTGTPELAVRGAYRLQNTGKTPLNYIEVTLPPEPRRSGLQVSLDGSPVATQPADELAPAGTVRIPISPALAQKKKRDLLIEYRLAGSVGDVSATPSFYLETRGWYPALREREGLFGSGGAPPEKWDLRVTVPRDFLVHASGQQKGRKRRSDSVEHRFRQRRGEDFDPFVVSGRYHEQRGEYDDVSISFWTFSHLPSAAFERVGQRVSSTWRSYERAFGLFDGERRPLLVAEGLFRSGGSVITVGGPIPFGFLYNGTSLREPLTNDVVWPIFDELIAWGWFGGSLKFAEPDWAWSDALGTYSVYVASEGRASEQSRAEKILALMKVRAEISNAPRNVISFHSPPEWPERALQRNKLQLFLFAAEGEYGKAALRAALARVVQALRGRQFTPNDLRVAIHLETGEDPAEFFRQWLNQPGIPEDFRKRYEKQAPGSR